MHIFFRRTNTILITSIFISLGSSCGKDGASVLHTPLDGSWTSGCIVENVGSKKVKWVFKQLAYTEERHDYGDTVCVGEQAQFDWTGTFSIGGSASSAAPSGAINLNLNLTAVTRAEQQNSNATKDNNNGYCGFTDWAVGIQKTVTGKICTSFITEVTKVGAYYSIYKIDGTTLYLGNNGDTVTSESSRPTSFDSTILVKDP